MGLSTGQLTRMRAQVAALLPQSAKIRRVTRTSDGMGGWTESYMAASLETHLTGDDNDAIFTAKPGVDGNNITITYADPQGNNEPLDVNVSNVTDIIVSLATDEAGLITSTVAEIVTAVNEDVEAKMLVLAEIVGEGVGAGVVTAMAKTALTGGSDTTVACRLDPVSQQMVAGVIADQQSVVVRYRLTVPHDADLRVEDKVQVDERTYRVLQLDADHSWRMTRRAIVSEVR